MQEGKIEFKDKQKLDITAAIKLMADRYGISISTDPSPYQFQASESGQYGCDPSTKRVWLPKNWEQRHDGEKVFFLHELAHVLCQPPDADITTAPEDWIQAQFETIFAREFLDKSAARVVTVFQTTVRAKTLRPNTSIAPILGDIDGYETESRWQDGIYRLIRLGVIDDERKVTWSWPQWENLDVN